MISLPPSACLALCRELPLASNLDHAMRIVEQVRQDILGDGLLTVNQVAWPVPNEAADIIELQRIWTSRPAVYPVAGRKRKTLTAWTRHLLLSCEVFVGEGTTALTEAFDDHHLILSMGLHTVVNVPLVQENGECFATFNVLGARKHWAPEQPRQIELLAALVRPFVAMHVSRHSNKKRRPSGRLFLNRSASVSRNSSRRNPS